jgi:hypothetical protein
MIASVTEMMAIKAIKRAIKPAIFCIFKKPLKYPIYNWKLPN